MAMATSNQLSSRRIACFTAVCANCITAGAIFTFPMWGAPFSSVMQLSAAQTSLLASAAILGEYVAAAGWGALADKRGPGAVSWSAAVCFGLGYAGLAWRYTAAVSRLRRGLPPVVEVQQLGKLSGTPEWPLLCVFNLLVGCGTAASYFGSVVSSIKSTPARHSGLAIGFPCAVFGLSPLFLSSLAGYFTVQVSVGSTEELDPGRWLWFLAIFLASVNFLSGFGLAEVPCDSGSAFEPKLSHDSRDRLSSAPGRRIRRTESATSSLRGDVEHSTETTALLGSSRSTGPASQSILSLLLTPSFWLFGAMIFLSTGPAEMVLSQLGVIVECLLGVKIEPPTTSLGKTTSSSIISFAAVAGALKRHEPRALALRRLHVQVMSVSNTVSRLLIGLLSDWVSYASEPLPPHSPVTEEEDVRPKTLKQKLQARFHRPPRISRLSFVVVACLALSATFAFTAFKLEHPAQLWLLSVVVGAAYGVQFTIAPSVVRAVYPVQQFGRNWGLLTWFSALGALLFTPLFGIMLDRAQSRQKTPLRASLTALDVSLTLTRNTRHLASHPTVPHGAHRGLRGRAGASRHPSTNIRSSAATTQTCRRQSRSSGSFDSIRDGKGGFVAQDDADWSGDSPFGGRKRRQRLTRKSAKVYGQNKAGALHKREGSITSGWTTDDGSGRHKVASNSGIGLRWLGHRFRSEKEWRKEIMKQAAADANVVQRCVAVVRAYENVLDSCYKPKGNVAQSIGVSSSDRRIISLVEMMTLSVGWDIEDNVAATIHADSGTDEDDPFAAGSDAENQSRDQRKALLDEQVDAAELVDEWYSVCPDYCSGWLLGQHATSILLANLDDSVPGLLEWLLETCVSYGATNEAVRFFEPMLDLALREPPGNYDCLDFAVGAERIGQRHGFLCALEKVLLSSSFADRLFYSDFIGLSRAFFDTGCERSALGVVSVICDVATCMISAIQEASRNGNPGGDRLVKEVVSRVQSVLDRAAPSLLVYAQFGETDQYEALKRDFLVSVSEFIQQVDIGIDLVCSRVPAIAFACALSASFDDDDHDRDMTLLESLDAIAAEPDSDIAYYLEYVIKSSPTHVLASWCNKFAQKGLYSLRQILSTYTFQNYDLLLDVVATHRRAVLDKSVFAERPLMNASTVSQNSAGSELSNQTRTEDDIVVKPVVRPATPAGTGTRHDVDLNATPLGSTKMNRMAASVLSRRRPQSAHKTPNRSILARAQEQRARKPNEERRPRMVDLTSEYEPDWLDLAHVEERASIYSASSSEEMDDSEELVDSSKSSSSEIDILDDRANFAQSHTQPTKNGLKSVATSEFDELDVLVRPRTLPSLRQSRKRILPKSSSQPTISNRDQHVADQCTKRRIQSFSPEKRKRRMRMVVQSTAEEGSADELGL
ncbi:hypothetical protein OIV83_001640 [Microbotryomycetes sp. JL201]|nr:hypothetical protein OIV83_001640 [Microbotryomycetes sp. JL201]